MPLSGYKTAGLTITNTVAIPASCCPVSKNPCAGSEIAFCYQPDKWVVEVYSLRELARRFVGGLEATEHYPTERNMEGLCELMAQMVADAVGAGVSFTASIVLDCGKMGVSGEVSPQ